MNSKEESKALELLHIIGEEARRVGEKHLHDVRTNESKKCVILSSGKIIPV